MPVKADSSSRLKIIAMCGAISTRILLEISLDPGRFQLEFSETEIGFEKSFLRHSHDIYIIDTAWKNRESNKDLFKRATASKFKGLRRTVLLVSEKMPPEKNAMHPFGPLCFLEADFTRARLAETLEQVLSIRDTGVRVKGDSDFFDITKMKR